MKIALACDHAGFEAKEELKAFLESQGLGVIDVGTHSNERCDYPDYAKSLVQTLRSKLAEQGILICGSGIGVSMVANRFRGIRAALCRSAEEAVLSRQHNDANVLCLGARINSSDELKQIIKAWLGATFEGGRHTERIALFNDLGE